MNPFIISMMNFTGIGLTCIRSDRVVFHKLEFSVAEGEVLYLRGPNGSGKSSLIRIMAGLLRPATGHIFWNGENIPKVLDSFKENLHYVGHQNAIKGVLSVRENLSFWASMCDFGLEKQSIDEALEKFELNNLANLPARFLSAGQARKLNLARLSATAAPLWLLDEPANSLDEASANSLIETIANHQKNGGIVIMATHGAVSSNGKVLELSDFAFDPFNP